jgi:hypothetical protein
MGSVGASRNPGIAGGQEKRAQAGDRFDCVRHFQKREDFCRPLVAGSPIPCTRTPGSAERNPGLRQRGNQALEEGGGH